MSKFAGKKEVAVVAATTTKERGISTIQNRECDGHPTPHRTPAGNGNMGRGNVVPMPYSETPEEFRRFNEFLNLREAYIEAVENGAPEMHGYFIGDGVPRNASGRPFEPLDWEGVKLA